MLLVHFEVFEICTNDYHNELYGYLEDVEKLKLDNIIFDSGNEVTNFVTDTNGRLSFGSIDQIGKGKIKTGTPYKMIFTPKVNLTNTMGLYYTIIADAVDENGNKIKLNVR